MYPDSLFAVGKCFVLKDLLTKVILLVMRARIGVFKFLFVVNMIYLSKLSNKLPSMLC